MERFKKDKTIVTISIGETNCFVETTKEFKKLDEVNYAEERIKMKKNTFEA